MSNIVLVTGGARSGKSNFAELLCREQNNSTAYIATSVAFDDEMKDRIKKHQDSRPKEWKTYEIYKDIYSIVEDLDKNHDTVILDCLTLMINNLMFTYGIDVDKATTEEINSNDNVLTPGRYVGVENNNEDDIPFNEKMKNITSELSTQFEESHRLEEEIKKNLKAIGYDI